MYKKIIKAAFLGLLVSAAAVCAAPVSKATADRALKGWMRSGSTKMGKHYKKRDLGITETYVDKDGEPIFYVTSFRKGGYVVQSADDLIEPVIAFSDSGTFPTDPDATLHDILLTDMSERSRACDEFSKAIKTKAARGNGPRAVQQRHFNRKKARWDQLVASESATLTKSAAAPKATSIDDVRVNTLISTRWNQSSPENYYTPGSGPCGCVATAMAQLMRYHEHTYAVGSRTGTIKVEGVSESATTRGGDGSGGSYVWSAMPNNPGSSDHQVGALCYDAGISVGMNYKSSAGSSYTERAAGALTGWFGYDSGKKFVTSGTASQDQLETMVNANLDASYPVILGVHGSGGHAIICDGYGFDSSVPYHHLNMGWAGSSDAWYNLPNIDTGLFTSDYDQVYKIVYNAFPNGVGAIISGRVLDHSGTPLSGVIVEGISGSQIFSATTDNKGIYALVHVPQGACNVRVVDEQMSSDTLFVSIGNTSAVDWCPNKWGADLTVSDAIHTADEDAYVLSISANSNYGSSTELVAQEDASGTVYESFIKFDLTGVSDTVETAQLRLTVDENGADSINEVYVMNDDSWTEGSVTFNNRPTAGQKIYELTPTYIPTSVAVTTLIGGTTNNGNLDNDSIVTNISGDDTWTTKVADSKYYILADPTGSGYYNGWTLSRSGSFPGGNNTIGMLTYAHPTAFDSGTTPDFCAFANSGGVQLESDSISASLTTGSTLDVTFRASTHSSTATFTGSAAVIFDKGLAGETTVSASPSISTPFTQVTFDGSNTSYMGAYSASCTVPGDFSTVSVRVGVRNSSASVGCSIDDVELELTSTGVGDADKLLCIDVGPAVVSELSGNGIVSFCLRGDNGLVKYCSSESEHPPLLVLSQHVAADTAADWEADSTQPDGQWSYGTYGVGADHATFSQYTVRSTYNPGTQSWIGGAGEIWDWSAGYPRVGKYATAPYGGAAHPTLGKMESVKRWTSNIKGVITAQIDVQQIQDSTDGNIFTVRKNGVDIWSKNLEDSYRASKMLEISVYPGDVIDFAVDPVGSGSADWCYLRARITTKTPTANRAQLRAHYDFDEAVDMPTDADGDMYDRKMYAYDYSGKNQFATLKNCDTWTVWNAGKIGNAIDLDGVNDYVATPVIVKPSINSYSVAAWIKGGAANDVLISQAGGQNWIGFNAAGQLMSGIMPTGGSALSAVDSWDAVAWHHVAVVWDGSRRYLYVDGVGVAGDSADIASPVSASGAFNIGVDSALGNPFDGMVDDLGIWSRVLSAKEIAVLYEAGGEGDTLAFAHSEVEPSLDLVTVDLNATAYKYDFGTIISPVMSGWTAITDNTGGDISWSIPVDSRDRGNPGGINDINRDFVFSADTVTLEHKIANGDWNVVLNMGDVDVAHDDMVVKAEGITMGADVDSAVSSFPYVNFDVSVNDGSLSIEFSDAGGTDLNWIVTRMSLNLITNVPPVATGDTVSVAENSPAGTAAGTVAVSDPDDTFTFAITAGNSSNLFAIDGSGHVTTTGVLDYETVTQHVLTVTVTDSGSLTDTASVTVNVTDEVENLPPVAAGDTVSVAENSPVGTAAGAVAVSDPGDTFTFAITAGNSSSLFAIDGSGHVTTTGPLDYETATQHVLTVTVTDSGLLTATATVTVNVTDASEGQAIPGRIEAEDYNTGGEGVGYHDTTAGNTGGAVRTDDVDIEARDGGYNVGWVAAGEWLAFTVNATDGYYDIVARVATTATGRQMQYTLGGSSLGTVTLPNTGNWGTFQDATFENVYVSGGVAELRIVFTTGSVNLNWIEFQAVPEPPPAGTDIMTVDTAQTSFNYDLGPADSVVQSGWTKISPDAGGDITWSAIVDSRDRGTSGGANNINRDFVFSSNVVTLEHKVANGSWHVVMNMGDANGAHDNMIVKAEGITKSAGTDAAANTFPYVTFDATVTDGSLSIEFSDGGGTDPNWVVTRMSLSRNADPAPIGSMVAFKAQANNKYVCSDNRMDGTNRTLLANRTAVGSWEKFTVADAGDGYVSLVANYNSKYVRADAALSAANLPLAANHTGALTDAEKYMWWDNGDGTVSLQSKANSKFVAADQNLDATNWPTAANTATIEAKSKFTVEVQ